MPARVALDSPAVANAAQEASERSEPSSDACARCRHDCPAPRSARSPSGASGEAWLARRAQDSVDRWWARIMIRRWGSDLPMRRQLKNRARPFSGAHNVVFQHHIRRKARAPHWRPARSRAHRCAPRRRVRRRPALHPWGSSSIACDCVELGSRLLRAGHCRHLPRRAEAERRGCGLAASCWLAFGRGSRRRPCRLGASGTAARARRQTAPARSARANGVGDALKTEDRSHRLSLAHPPLCRSRSSIPFRLASGSAVGRGALQRRAVRYRRRVLEPPRRAAARSTR